MSEPRASLLIDIGNTRIKAVLRQGEQLAPLFDVPTNVDELALELEKQAHLNVAGVVCCCVADEAIVQNIRSWAESQANVCFFQVQASRTGYGLRSAYEMPSQLGDDRWVAMIGAYQDCRHACLVIDSGTAVTVDLVDAKGLHLGGAIFPGAASMRSALVSTTHRLPWVQGTDAMFGASTQACIAGGTLHAVIGGLSRFISEARKRVNKTSALTIYLTGGGAEELQAGLEGENVVYRPMLVHEGLAYVQSVGAEHKEDDP